MQALRETTNTRHAAQEAPASHHKPAAAPAGPPRHSAGTGSSSVTGTDSAPATGHPRACYPGTLLALRASGPRFSSDDFDLCKKPLGRGQFGLVWKARHRESRRWVVIKVLEKAEILKQDDMKRHVHHEIEVQARCVHPHILRLFATYQDPERGAWRGRVRSSCAAARAPPRAMTRALFLRTRAGGCSARNGAKAAACPPVWSRPPSPPRLTRCGAPLARPLC